MRSTTLQCAALAALVVTPIGLVTTPSAAAGQIAPGSTLHFTGLADATEVGSPGVLIAFPAGVTVHPSANTGTFASLNQPGPGTAAAMATLIVGNGAQSIPNFLQAGPFTFALSHVPSGTYGQDDCYVPPAAGQRCTPYQLPSFALSPFYLENVASTGSEVMLTALVKFDVVGTVHGHGETSAFRGTITATFEGLSFQEALMGLEAHGLRGVPFTAHFVAHTSVVPEPSTAGLVAVGLTGIAGIAGIGGAARRRRARTG